MAWYYNIGRGNLPLTLSKHKSISVPGNSWVELLGADETTPSVRRAKRKGQLHYSESDRKPGSPPVAEEAAPVPIPVPAPAPPLPPAPPAEMPAEALDEGEDLDHGSP